MSYLTIIKAGLSESGRTRIWSILSDEGVTIGSVSWFGRWRCYAFFPCMGTVFERHCLRDLADFCEQETAKWRAHRKEQRAATPVALTIP